MLLNGHLATVLALMLNLNHCNKSHRVETLRLSSKKNSHDDRFIVED